MIHNIHGLFNTWGRFRYLKITKNNTYNIIYYNKSYGDKKNFLVTK